jgi:hypothetical protein
MPVIPVGVRGDEDQMIMTSYSSYRVERKVPENDRDVENEWAMHQSPQLNNYMEEGFVTRRREKFESSPSIGLHRRFDGDKIAEELRVNHVCAEPQEGLEMQEYRAAESREDMNEQSTMSSLGGETVRLEQQNTRGEIRDMLSTRKSRDTQTGTDISGTLLRPATRQLVSRSLSPKKRSHRRGAQQRHPTRRFSLSPSRRKQWSNKSPRRKSRDSGETFNGNNGPQNAASTKSSKRTVKILMNDCDRGTSRHEDVDTGSSDEALEFTKDRYKRRKSHTTNRPDVAAVTRPKQHIKATLIRPFQKAQPVKLNSSDDTISVQRTDNPSSSECESSTTGASFTEAEKGRLRRQMKRRAMLKRKAAQAAKAKTDSMSFLDGALANAASDFVSLVIGQLGLAQPFVFPTSPLAGESGLNDEYNLLRWEEYLPSKPSTPKKVYTGSTMLEVLLGWEVKEGKSRQSSPQSSYENIGDTERRLKSDLSVDEKSRIEPRHNSTTTARFTTNPSMKKESEPIAKAVKGTGPEIIDKKEIVKPGSMAKSPDTTMILDNVRIISQSECPPTAGTLPLLQKQSESVIKTVKGVGPAVLDEREIAMVARSMAKLQDNSMTSDDGDVSGDFSHSKENDQYDEGRLKVDNGEVQIHGTDPLPVLSQSLTVSDQMQDFDLVVSSDSEENQQNQRMGSAGAVVGNDDVNSLSNSIEDKAGKAPRPPPSQTEDEDSSVAKLIKKFERELPMRSPAPTCASNFLPKQGGSPYELAVALSLSTDDSILPSSGWEGPTCSTLVMEDQAANEDREIQSTVEKTSVVPDNHLDELITKIKEHQDERGTQTQSSETTNHKDELESTPCSAFAEASMSHEPEFLPHVMMTPGNSFVQPIDRPTTLQPTAEEFPQGYQCGTAVVQAHDCQLTCPKVNSSIELESMSASLFGYSSLGEESLDTGRTLGPLPVDIDDIVFKIDGVVQRLIKAGKLPGGESDTSFSEFEHRTLQNNTAELLRNLAVLKRRRRLTGAKHVPPQLPRQSVPSIVNCDRQLQEPNNRISSVEPRLPSPHTAPILSTTSTKESPSTMMPTSDPSNIGNKPYTNLARIRARRDEAVLRIKETTQKLSCFTNPIIHTGPIPINTSYTFGQSGMLGYRESSNADLLNERNDSIRTSNLIKKSMHKVPPRPEITFGLHRKNISNVTFQNPDSRNTRTSLFKKSFDNASVVPISTSDIDMEEWEKVELEKLPLLLSKTKSDEQGEARFSTIHRDSSPLSASAHPQNLRLETSVIAECHENEEEDTDDTDSTDTFGSESDSERLERIAGMIQELRLRRQRKR